MAGKIELTEADLEAVEAGAAEGLTEKQIAKALGISYRTFQRRKKDGPSADEIDERLKRARERSKRWKTPHTNAL